jgi:hypothetical protein
MKKTIVASIIALTMGVGGVGAASQFGGVVEGTKKVGEATKDVGKATVDTTKKVVGTAGTETKKAAKKTKNTVSGVKCVDGTRQSAKTGCAHHGGIRK